MADLFTKAKRSEVMSRIRGRGNNAELLVEGEATFKSIFDGIEQAKEHVLVDFPTTDGREFVFCRCTQPEKDHKLLLAQLGWELPPQSPSRITQKGERLKSADLLEPVPCFQGFRLHAPMSSESRASISPCRVCVGLQPTSQGALPGRTRQKSRN
jgi:hypothetical protein